MTKYLIGIDPDLEKSGVAVLGQSLELKNLTFPETVELFRTHQDEIKRTTQQANYSLKWQKNAVWRWYWLSRHVQS